MINPRRMLSVAAAVVGLVVAAVLVPAPAFAAGATIQGYFTQWGTVTLYNATTGAVITSVESSVEDEDYNYQFTGLAPGDYKVGFHVWDDVILDLIPYVPEFWDDKPTLAEAEIITITGTEVVPGIDASLVPAAPNISGTLTSPDPVVWNTSGASREAEVYNEAGELVPHTVARIGWDAQYKIWGLQPGTYYVAIDLYLGHANGRLAKTFAGDTPFLSEATPIVVAEGQTTTGPDIELREGATISGTVWAGPDVSTDYVVKQLNPNTGKYEEVGRSTSSSTYFGMGNLWPGTFIVRFIPPASTGLAPEWWDDAPYEAVATPIELEEGEWFTSMSVELEGMKGGRIGGTDRYAANVNMSRLTFPAEDGPYAIDVMYVASGEKYPDALSAGPAAIAQDGGLLLVAPNTIPASTRAEIIRLNPERIVVVGGELSVSPPVFDQLEALTDEIERIGGADRYEVSRALIESAFGECGDDACLDSVFVATGNNFPDALSAGPAAGHIGGAVLLVNGTSSTLDEETLDLLDSLGVQDAYIAGGPASVTPAIQSALNAALPGDVTRFSGVDRYAAAANINDAIFGETEAVFIAAGAGFADALAGGPLAGSFGAPLYLAPQSCLTVPAIMSLIDRNPSLIVLLGGPNSIADSVLYQAC